MERPPHNQHEPDPELPADDEARITRGIAEAMASSGLIDDATARRIAARLHGGQDTALCTLASSGALEDDLAIEIADATGALPMTYETWGDALLDYVHDRTRAHDRGPRQAWDLLTSDDPTEAAQAADNNQQQHRRALFERYVSLGINPEDAISAIEADDLLHADWPDAQSNAPPEGDTEQHPEN
ncbi:hypothetical protein WIS52_14990 [Pseudonocardia nematodicida]|uniref:Uncharacterized protein n=1 Tax=Pseudonocardia nematodicida TaxID=1206997 RepID=A0ABV1KEJ9_9PSEU